MSIRAWSAKPPPAGSLPDVTIPRPYHDQDVATPAPSSTPSAHHRPRRPTSKEELRRFMGRRIRYTPRED